MKYFLVSKDGDDLSLESFEAYSDKEALLHVVDSWNGFTKDDDYQYCKNKSVREIGNYLATMNMSDEIIDLALYREIDITTFGEEDPKGPLWDINDYLDK